MLGGSEVRPATLEITRGETRAVPEPRLMQVLVALAREQGRTVSRDDLIQSCWGGRIVGEDAIHRCAYQLRRLAQRFGGFDLEVIRGVGLRLVEVADASSSKRRRRWPWMAGAARARATVAIAATVFWKSRPATTLMPGVAILRFEAARRPAVKVLARAISDDAERGDGSDPDLRASRDPGRAALSSAGWSAGRATGSRRPSISDARTQANIWSGGRGWRAPARTGGGAGCGKLSCGAVPYQRRLH